MLLSLASPFNSALAEEPAWELSISTTSEHLNFKDFFVDVDKKVNGKTLSLLYRQSSLFAFNIYYRPEEKFTSLYINRCDTTQFVCPAVYALPGDFKFSSYGVNWQPTYNIYPDLQVFGKLGISQSKYKTSIPNENPDNTNVFYGLGLSFHVFDNISLTTSYEREKDASFLSLGIGIRF